MLFLELSNALLMAKHMDYCDSIDIEISSNWTDRWHN